MLPSPPCEVMKIATKGRGSPFHNRKVNPVMDRPATLGAAAAIDKLRLDGPMPRDPPVTLIIDSRAIDWAARNRRSRMPVFAIRPVVVRNGNMANLAKRQLAFVWLRIPPHTAIPAIEATRAAFFRPAIGHGFPVSLTKASCLF